MITTPTMPESSPPPERLTIAHLLVWTVMSAVFLGLDRATIIQSEGWLKTFSQVMAFCHAPLFGAGASALVLLVWRVASGGPRFPSQPGHWLLLLSGLGGIVALSIRAILALAVGGLPGGTPSFLAIRLLAFVAGMILYPFAIRDSRGPWRAVFALGLAITLLGLPGILIATFHFRFSLWMFQVDSVLRWIFTLAVIVAAGVDMKSQARRDYLHWTGIVVLIAYTALSIAVPILIRSLRAADGS